MTCREKCYIRSFYRSNVDKIKLHNLHIRCTALVYYTYIAEKSPAIIPASQRHLYAYEIRVINKTHKAYFLLHRFLVLLYNFYFITAIVFYLTQGQVTLVQILYILSLMDITLKIRDYHHYYVCNYRCVNQTSHTKYEPIYVLSP